MGFQTATQSSARRARSPRRATPGEAARAARAASAASAARAAPNPFPAEPPRAARRAPRPLACPAPAAHDQPLRRAELVEAATPLSRASHEQLDSDISQVQEELAALGEVQRELAKSGRLSHSLPELALSLLARGSSSVDLGAPLSSRSSTRSAMLAEWSVHEGSEEERANADFIARQQRRLRAASCPETRQSGSDDLVARVLAVRTPRLGTAPAFWPAPATVPDAPAAPGISPTAAVATAAAAAAAAAVSFRSRGARPSPLDTSASACTSGKTTAAARPPSAGKPPLAPTPVNDENRAGNRAGSSPRLREPESARSCEPRQCASPSIRISACRVRARLRCPLR
jgi:hypothetical protein